MNGCSDPLTEAELAQALQGLAAKKAIPPHAASMQLWKIGADIVIPAVANICQQFWQDITAFPDKPSELRPISLTEAGGKIFAKALNNRIRPLVSEAAATWPQFAYLQGRSIDHAIARAVAHCSRL